MTSMMDRRAFLAGVTGGIFPAPLAAACRTAHEVRPPPPPPLLRQIQQVELPRSESTIVWSHLNKVEPLNSADVSPWAWREADGTVNLFIAAFEAYRLRGST